MIMYSKWKAINDLSRSARVSIHKGSGVSLLLFPAAYTSFQNPVTSVILERSAWFTYHFVVLFLCYWNSLFFTFPTFSDLPHFGSSFDVPSMQTSNNEVRKPIWRIVHVHTRNHLVCTDKHTDIRKNDWLQLVKSGCLFYKCKDVTTT